MVHAGLASGDIGAPFRALSRRGARRATPTTALSVKPPVKMRRVSLKGARASVRSLTMPEEVTPPFSTSMASSHSRRSLSGSRSGSCTTAGTINAKAPALWCVNKDTRQAVKPRGGEHKHAMQVLSL